jgi:hypothetical protein
MLTGRWTCRRTWNSTSRESNVADEPNALIRAIAQGVPSQIATFIVSDDTLVTHPETDTVVEVPVAGPLPDALQYIPWRRRCRPSFDPDHILAAIQAGERTQ